MPCTTPNCPAPLASAPRRYHSRTCPYAASRGGKSTTSGGLPPVRVREDLAVELRRIKALGLEDEAVEALQSVKEGTQ